MIQIKPASCCLLSLALLNPNALAQDGYDALWSRATLYEDPDNKVVQRFALSGRAQAEWVYYDADQGDYDDSLWRRFRFGFKADVAGNWTAHLEGDFDLNKSIDDSYQRLTDAYIAWSPGNNWKIKGLKHSAGFTLDGYTSSRKLLTPERNNLSNNLWYTDEYFTGLSAAGECRENLHCSLGVYSTEDSDEISQLEAGFFTLLSMGHDFGPALGQDKLMLRGFHVYNNQDGNAATPEYRHIASLISEWESGDWGLWADISAGWGYDGQSNVTGIVAMPFYYMTPRQQAVFRFTWIHSDDDNGIRVGRYENEIISGRGDEYREWFAGFNWFFYGHKLKWQNGLQYTEMDDNDGGDGEYQGWGFASVVRIYWD